jgi:hypothetical protein
MSKKTWLIIGALVVIALAVWYYMEWKKKPENQVKANAAIPDGAATTSSIAFIDGE